MQNLLLAAGIIAGLFSVYIDSRPGWDDTGILVAGLFLISGLLTFLGHRRPWLIALAIGVWIPAYEIYSTGDLKLLILLLIPFAGAYLGCVLQQGYRRAVGPVS